VFLKRFLSVVGVFLFSWCTYAQAVEPEQFYQIEVIVFSHINNEGLGSEYWPALPPQAVNPNAIVMPDDQWLAQTQWKLQSVDQSLKRNNYSVLMHRAWLETAANLRKNKTIRLTGGEDFGNNLYQVSGTMAILLERYFNIYFNLRFLIPWEQLQSLNLTNIDHHGPYAEFKMEQPLRMRSNELNYIDHPLYGIFVEIIPATQPQAQAAQ
jgi:hypothetical protein